MKFQGFPPEPKENYWQYPKIMNGHWKDLSGSEQKALDYILRHTWGWQKTSDKISYSQFINGIKKNDGTIIDRGIGLSPNTLRLAIKGLKEKRFIIVIENAGKENFYLLNINNTPPKTSGLPRLNQADTPPKLGDTIDNNNNKNNNVAPPVATIIYPSFLDKLLESKQKHIKIIGIWVREVGIELPNEEVYESVVKRNLRSARLLVGYKEEDIVATIKILKNTDYIKKFTLETVGKYIDFVITEKKLQDQKIIRFEEIVKPDGKKVIRVIYSKEK